MGHTSAHHTRIRSNGNHLGKPDAGEDALISPVALPVIISQIHLGHVEGIRILHGEFPDADQSAAGAGFIPELGLDLVDHEGITQIAATVFPHQLHRRFLVGHPQQMGTAVPVAETEKLAADAGCPARLLP
ncbi:hypothetical protein D3C75_1073110 [compost metagenome]